MHWKMVRNRGKQSLRGSGRCSEVVVEGRKMYGQKLASLPGGFCFDFLSWSVAFKISGTTHLNSNY